MAMNRRFGNATMKPMPGLSRQKILKKVGVRSSRDERLNGQGGRAFSGREYRSRTPFIPVLSPYAMPLTSLDALPKLALMCSLKECFRTLLYALTFLVLSSISVSLNGKHWG